MFCDLIRQKNYKSEIKSYGFTLFSDIGQHHAVQDHDRSGFLGWGGRGLSLLALGWDALGLTAIALGHVGGAVCVPTVSLQGSYSVPTSSQSNPALLLVWLKSRCTTQLALSSS